ncbi:F0F1 ATP synthase subunit A [Apilactobacillus timberlakei]|uniref:ATP synthase subunit a n=1 Tax=Apilactobacillus timberlakei TaxID=2008380 RepID=A0ABY2YS82_9LACO|nr:F0F1 ATP synthase subunit A [Apilactobacillus timberlakei]TPR12638.1 F0F1 ATP synthase subunit A [Apilactobacillus timberlakei]TPR13467.1 F0F1 ATP synthase subunit A [Apilactobacillus timberlakei]TPR15540.1 F0F1 ATP synthase subunit A [Apilactobacillus timberlakei]
MNEPVSTFKLFGLTFDIGNMVSLVVVAAIVFFFIFALSRKLQIQPTKKQNVLEMIVEYTNGLSTNSLSAKNAKPYGLYAFVLFVFLFISNQLGLFLEVAYNGVTYVKSPTSNPVVTMTLAVMALGLAHFAGVSKLGFKGYFSSTYLKPFKLWLPLNIFEEFANFLTLGLRLFGNIFAGELLLGMVSNLVVTHGVVMVIPGFILGMAWVGFSIFIGTIQSLVFVILTFVYISQKIQPEE